MPTKKKRKTKTGVKIAFFIRGHDNTDQTGTAYSASTSAYDVNIFQQAGSLLDSRNRTIAIGDLA